MVRVTHLQKGSVFEAGSVRRMYAGDAGEGMNLIQLFER